MGSTGSDYIKVKLCRNYDNDISEIYEYKVDFFENGELEELLHFLQDFQKSIEATGAK